MRVRPPSRSLSHSLPLLLVLALTLVGCAAGHTSTDPTGVHDDDFGTARAFTVTEDGTLNPTPDAAAEGIWELYARIATREYAATMMSSYRVGNAPDSDTLAYVSPDPDAPGRWTLAANEAFADDRDLLTSTLVHEFAHVLSLNTTEIDADSGPCPTLAVSEGCARAGSAILDFQRQFWAAYADAPNPDNDDSAVADAFYAAHEADFVSAYAATNVVEDFAETFMTYVLETAPADASSPIGAKMAFFDAHPSWAAQATRIRTALGR